MPTVDHKLTKPRSMQAKMLHEDDNTAIIGLYGVVFDGYFQGKDIVGEFFHQKTDFKLKRASGAPVHIDHTGESYAELDGQEYLIKGIKGEVGEIIEVTPDDIGLYMQLQFEKSNEYWGVVEAMYNSGRMGASTGSDHRVQKSADGRIDIWPINEVSLTLTPAEPRTTEKVTRIKAADSDEITFKRNGETIKISIEPELIDPLTKSINETTDAESAEHEPEVATVTGIESDTSDSDILEEADLSANETAELSAEVLDMGKDIETTPEVEAKGFDFESAFKSLNTNISGVQAGLETQVKSLSDRLEAIENEPQADIVVNAKSASVLQLPKGDSEANLVKAWATGNAGQDLELKASNATDMNIGTAADGGNLTQEGFYNQIIAKMQESDLVSSLPVMRLPGTETTVDIPTMGGDYEEFVTTAEAATFDLDAPVVGQQQSTLVWKTKYTDISMQLLQSAAISGGVESLLSTYFGGALAATRNAMLVSEVATNGTNFKTFAGAAAIAFGELEDMLGNGVLGRYLSNDNAAAWVMQNSTLWNIRSIVGNDRQYWMDHNSNELLGYPVYRTQKAPAMATGLKSVLFGNWNYLAFREAPSLTLQRDPYTVGVKGQVRITAHFAAAFNVTQAEALGYATQA